MFRYLKSQIGLCVASFFLMIVGVGLMFHSAPTLMNGRYQVLPVTEMVLGMLAALGGMFLFNLLKGGEFSDLPDLPPETPDEKIPTAIVTHSDHKEP